MTREMAERNDAIRAAYSRGLGYRAIARHFGLSHQRVKQIVDPESERERRRRARDRKKENA